MGFFSGKARFPLCPEGLQQLICCDFIDLGMKETEYGEKHKVRIVWQTADLEPKSGKPYRVSKQYTASLHEKATLRKDLEAWLKRKLTPQEADEGEFDPEQLIGINAMGMIVHSDDGKYANIQAIMPLDKRYTPLTEVVDYVRVKDRPADGQAQKSADDTTPF